MNDFKLIKDSGNKKFYFFDNYPLKFFVKSIMAGSFLGIAMILSLSLGSILNTYDVNIAKIGYSLFFGLTFVLIIFLNGELFTGNCFSTIFPLIKKDQSMTSLIKMWIVCLIGNSVGVSVIAWLFIKSTSLSHILNPYIQLLLQTKLDYTPSTLMIKSILCNFIVCIATYVAIKVTDEMAKTFIMLLVISTFVITGFDHCIANIGLYIMGITLGSVNLDLSLLNNIFLSVVGNIIGGSILLGIPVYYSLNINKTVGKGR